MKQYNFQINPDSDRRDWEQIQAYTDSFCTRHEAIDLAIKLARLLKAEVRLTCGNDPAKLSGAYFSIKH